MLHAHEAVARCIAVAVILYAPALTRAQQLEPRAYSVSPRGTNFAVVGFGRSSGDVTFDPALPIEDGASTLHAFFFGYARAIGFAGRSASIAVQAPYVWGTLQGLINGSFEQARRSGLADPTLRFAVNLYGAPAMDLEEFKDYRQKTTIGSSVAVVAPLGQYDPARFVNIGSNRWSVKPEIGLSRREGRWYFDLYLGAWVFTDNSNFRGGVRSQNPIGSLQMHVSRNIRRRLWVAFDANYYFGGRTSFNGSRNADIQRNSRAGGTLSIPVTARQSLKFTGSAGARTTIGANFVSIGVAYQYLWGGGL